MNKSRKSITKILPSRTQLKRRQKSIIKSKSTKSTKKQNCILRSKIELRSYQIFAVDFINSPIHNSLLVVLGTGMGKTLTALTASQCYLDANPTSEVIVVSPKSIIDNFEKEMIKYGSKLGPRYKFYSFAKFSNIYKNGNTNCNNKMIIIDEAHNIRNKGLRYEALFDCVKNSNKLLLLTATPFINKLSDFKHIINLLYRDDNILQKNNMKIPINIADDDVYRNGLNIIKTMLNDKVIFLNDKNSANFPRVIIKKKIAFMTHEYYNNYKKAINDKDFGNNPDLFYNGYRRAVNKVGADEYINQKLNIVIKKIRRKKLYNRKQTVIFTHWLEAGVKVLTKEFNKKIDSRGNKVVPVSYGIISGDVPSIVRSNIVKEFNNEELQVLIITLAGSEGLDLKGVRNIIILDPCWNGATMEQIIGRGVRYNSHAHLSEEDRQVDVYKLILKIPPDTEDKYILSGDELLYNIIDLKQKISNDIVDILSQCSIYKNSSVL